MPIANDRVVANHADTADQCSCLRGIPTGGKLPWNSNRACQGGQGIIARNSALRLHHIPNVGSARLVVASKGELLPGSIPATVYIVPVIVVLVGCYCAILQGAIGVNGTDVYAVGSGRKARDAD